MALPTASDVDLMGLIDAHIHSAPDVWPRFSDDLETARQAAAAGMRAILLKSHVTITADRAAIAEKTAGGLRVFGALSLNGQVGGLNPLAVEAALKLGAREVWLPTQDAANHHRWESSLRMAGVGESAETPEAARLRQQQGTPSRGLTVLDREGKPKETIKEILEMVRGADVILGTGHLSVEEIVAVVQLARRMGHRKILVTHPEAPMIRMPVDVQREIAGDGVFFERCYVNSTSFTGATVGVAEIAGQIRAVGIESTVLSTDLGQAANGPPSEGMKRYIADLLLFGFGWGEIRRMAGENPGWLLGL